mmetsp:Transcript_5973/g.6515  ORF Transcript_5973/g.6515 Transcript_5973/m.6515 type:complete len:93 (+) Transcript_5973:370-648(+)
MTDDTHVGFWQGAHWRENAHIVNQNWSLNEAGRRYQSLMDLWKQTRTDGNGRVETRGYHGTYYITVTKNGISSTTCLELSSTMRRKSVTVRL